MSNRYEINDDDDDDDNDEYTYNILRTSQLGKGFGAYKHRLTACKT
jgi:hypothetical protein